MRASRSSRRCARPQSARAGPCATTAAGATATRADAPGDVKPVIRLRAPIEGETVVQDEVQGRVVWQNKDLDDLVLLRSDGTPTYMLAVVVDDHDMGVTHIIRGDDHLTNAARQTQIYHALGWTVPSYGARPADPRSGRRQAVEAARRARRRRLSRPWDIFPAALRNYLVRLGWSHGDQEIFSTQEMIDAFDLKQIGRSPARFDFAKLESLNGHYMRQSSDEELVEALEDVLPELGPARGLPPALPPDLRARLLAAMPGLKERAKTLVELLDSAYFLYCSAPARARRQGCRPPRRDGAGSTCAGSPLGLRSFADWTAAALEDAVRAQAELLGVKLGQVAQPLRAALTGRATSPGIFDVMAVLGREETLGRLRDQVPDECGGCIK